MYHQDVDILLREWLTADQCVVRQVEFEKLFEKAGGEFERIVTSDASGRTACPVHSLVACVYWGVQQLERMS